MYGVEFGHTGQHCTFETLVTRFAIKDDAVNWLARIVHDVDLKDGHYDTPEAPGIEQLIAGLRATCSDDGTLLERGIEMFEALAGSKRTAKPSRGHKQPRGRQAGLT